MATSVKAIGYWRDEDRPDLPDPAEFVDADWDDEEREVVGRYLSAGRPTTEGCGCSPCRICGTPNGFGDFTDGVYLWPEGLAHYVLDHAVRLPEEVIQHACGQSQTENVGLIETSWWTDIMRTQKP